MTKQINPVVSGTGGAEPLPYDNEDSRNFYREEVLVFKLND